MNESEIPYREVIVAEGDLDTLRAWLESALGRLTASRDGADGLWAFSLVEDPLIQVSLCRHRATKFHYLVSVTYKPPHSAEKPWPTSAAMAQEAAGCMGCEVICPAATSPTGNVLVRPDGSQEPIDLNAIEL